MAIKILMPALSPTMTEGNLAKWLKKPGDKVKPGEVIAEIETDKATMEVESADSGTLSRIVVNEKSQGVKVNQLIGVLLEAGETDADADALIAEHEKSSASKPSTSSAPQPAPAAAPVAAPSAVSPAPSNSNTRVFASPLAKRMAAEKGVDISRIAGSGPRGRIVKADIENANYGAPQIGRNPIEFSTIPLTQMRATIAKRLQESKSTVPHFYLTLDCDVDELNKARNYINNKAPQVNGKPAYKVSVNDFVIKAAAVALRKVPQANASWTDHGIIQYNNIDISVAVSTPDGLITPIVQNADQKSLVDISREIKDLADRAKKNALKPAEFMGGSFTISNLGMYGVKQFDAIINPPQACILAVGAAEERAVVKNGVITKASVMTVTMSCDHRVVDGALAAILMQEFKAHIEQPVTMFL